MALQDFRSKQCVFRGTIYTFPNRCGCYLRRKEHLETRNAPVPVTYDLPTLRFFDDYRIRTQTILSDILTKHAKVFAIWHRKTLDPGALIAVIA